MVMNSNSRDERRPEEISVQVPRNCDFIQSRSVMVTFGYSNSIKALADSAFEATKERMSLMTGLSFPIQKQRDGSLSSFLCFYKVSRDCYHRGLFHPWLNFGKQSRATIIAISFPIGPEVRKGSRI